MQSTTFYNFLKTSCCGLPWGFITLQYTIHISQIVINVEIALIVLFLSCLLLSVYCIMHPWWHWISHSLFDGILSAFQYLASSTVADINKLHTNLFCLFLTVKIFSKKHFGGKPKKSSSNLITFPLEHFPVNLDL